jgi:hypothetical protein
LEGSSNFPAPGMRLLVQQTQLDNSILRNSNISLRNAQITQGLRILPQYGTNKLELPFGGLIGSILYPFGVSFLLPIFVIILVQERENRILVMMSMNGMKSWAYYSSHYITMLILSVLSAAVFISTGFASGLTLFTQTDMTTLIIVFFIWGNAQIALAFLLSTLFNKSRLALVITFLLVLCSVIVSLSISQLFATTSAPTALFLWPPFAFYRALGIMNVSSYEPARIPIKFKDLFGANEFSTAILFLFCSIFVMLVICFYFDAIIPSEFGVKKPWYFPISAFLNLIKKKKARDHSGTIITDEVETRMEDDDVKAERARVCDPNFPESDYPLVMKNMRKVYAGRGGSGPKLAVKDVTFAVEKGIIFGLLGPNGAVSNYLT